MLTQRKTTRKQKTLNEWTKERIIKGKMGRNPDLRIVAKPLPFLSSQLLGFKKLTSKKGSECDNFRPTNPLNGRKVEANFWERYSLIQMLSLLCDLIIPSYPSWVLPWPRALYLTDKLLVFSSLQKVSACKEIQGSLGFWILGCGFRWLCVSLSVELEVRFFFGQIQIRISESKNGFFVF